MTRLLGKTGTVSGVKATNSGILVEMLTTQEMSGGLVFVGEKSDVSDSPQAYVVSIGPAVDYEKLGFKVGDRVVVQGKYVPVPKMPGKQREMGIVDIYNIKAVLEETHE